MKAFIAAAACATAILPSPAVAQSTDLGRSVADLVGTLITTGKQRRLTAELSTPLTYDPAAGPLDPANKADPRNLEIAGVRIGMTVREAQLALRGAGYIDEGPRDDQPSYMGRVMWAWQAEYGVGPNTNDRTTRELVWNKGEEEITVSLLALPDGPRVESVFYWAKDGAPISKDEFTRRVLAKYGEPVNDDPNDLRWCTVKAPECEKPPEQTYPLLVAWPNGRQLRLFGNDPGLKQALDQRFAADVLRRKPADKAPSF